MSSFTFGIFVDVVEIELVVNVGAHPDEVGPFHVLSILKFFRDEIGSDWTVNVERRQEIQTRERDFRAKSEDPLFA